jgi:hypothetical protein
MSRSPTLSALVASVLLPLGAVRGDDRGEEPAADLGPALRALSSEGPEAVAAAESLPEGSLRLRELRRKADLLAPRVRLAADLSWAGARELPAIVRGLTLETPDVPTALDLHRIALPEHVPALLAGIDRGGPNAFAARIQCLRILADAGGADRHHDALVAAFLYSGERHRAEAAGRPPPPFPGVCGARDAEGGLPDSFEGLARAAWHTDDEDAAARGGPTVGVGWIWRWALRLRPAREDLAFLLEATEWKRAPKEWVFEGLASIDDPRARAEMEAWAEASGVARAAVAAAQARRGDPRALRALRRPGRDEREAGVAAERAALLSWALDPEAARKEWLARFLEEEDPSQAEPSLEPAGRWSLWIDGLEPREADLRWIGEALRRRGAPARHLCYWFTRVDPDALTPPLAATICERLASHRDGLPYWGEAYESDIEGNVSLGILEGQDREAVRRLLRTWAASADEETRRAALLDLARLGDDAFVDAMLASWREWDLHADEIGNVRHEKVREHLVARARSDREEDAEEVSAAVAGLFAWHGRPLRHGYLLRGPWTEEPHRSARAALLAGDAVAALAALADAVVLEELAFVDDPRVTARLRAIRESRDEDRLREATGLLALVGDASAAAEVRGFVADARIELLDHDQGALWASLAGDPALVATWASRLDANCCLAFHAEQVLRRVFPTVPADHGAAHLTFWRRFTERWFARNRGRFVWSRLLDGWVPGPR